MNHEWSQVSLGVLLSNAMEPRVYERNPRRGSLQPEFVRHRFPIKDGLSFGDVLAETANQSNALFARLMARDLYGKENA